MLTRNKSYIITKESEGLKQMTYDDFIMNIYCGHEFICEIEGTVFKILNLHEGYYTIRLGDKRYDISEEENIEEQIIYNNMTLKDLIINDMIKIKEIY